MLDNWDHKLDINEFESKLSSKELNWIDKFGGMYEKPAHYYKLASTNLTFGTSVWRSSGRRSGVAVRAVDCWQTT